MYQGHLETRALANLPCDALSNLPDNIQPELAEISSDRGSVPLMEDLGNSWSCSRGKRRPNLDLDLEVPIAQVTHNPSTPDVTPMCRGQNLVFFPPVYRTPWPTRSHACISPLPPSPAELSSFRYIATIP